MKTQAKLVAIAMVAHLSGCSTPTDGSAEGSKSTQAPTKWRIAQQDTLLAGGESKPYHFCAAGECELSTRKTLPRPAPTLMSMKSKEEARPAPAAGKGAGASIGPNRIAIPFAYNSAALSEEGKRQVDAFVKGAGAGARIEIVGLADSLRRDSYNQALAKRRAAAVRQYIASSSNKPGASIAASVSTGARIVRVTEDGIYPTGEAHNGRRVDMGVIGLEVNK